MKTRIKHSFDRGTHVMRAFSLTTLAVTLLLLSASWLHADTGAVSYTVKLAHTSFFDRHLVWAGQIPPNEKESQELWNIFTGVKRLDEALGGLELFVQTHTNSPWVPSLELNLADYYRASGYFDLALSHWQAVWDANKGSTDPVAVRLADASLAGRLALLSSLGRTDTMKAMFDETKDRRISPDSVGMVQRTKHSYQGMLDHPDKAYRCGTFALDAVSTLLTGTNYDRDIGSLPSPQTGFSLAALEDIANQHNLDMVAVERPSGADLIVPSVVHWKADHYAAILEKDGERYRVIDPTFRLGAWLTRAAIDAESSGQFLVSAKQAPATWRRLPKSESSLIFGKGNYPDGYTIPGPPCTTCPCPPGGPGTGGSGPSTSSGSSSSSPGGMSSTVGRCGGGSCTVNPPGPGGMPGWTVTDAEVAYWVIDEPLAYQPALGPRISFTIYYDSFGGGIPEMGNYGWGNSWSSFLTFSEPGFTSGSGVALYPAGGGSRTYSVNSGTPDAYTKTQLTAVITNYNPISFTLTYPSGAQDVYGFVPTNYYGGAMDEAFLTQKIDPQGHTITMAYNTNAMEDTGYDAFALIITNVVDGDGKTNIIYYTNFTNVMFDSGSGLYYTNITSNLIWQVVSPYSNNCTFAYGADPLYAGYYGDTPPVLTNVVDVGGMSSSFTWSPFDIGGGSFDGSLITGITTPYGTTTLDYQYFYFTNGQTGGSSVAYLVSTEPDGSHQMYFFYADPTTNILYPPSVYTDLSNVPTNRPLIYDPSQGMAVDTLDNHDWSNPNAEDYMEYGNSFYWNRQQFANLSTGFQATGATNWDLSQLTTNDFARGRLRHWLVSGNYGGGAGYQVNILSMEQEASQDGVVPGKMTWFGYLGKPAPWVAGNSAFPVLTLKVLPNGSNSYVINLTNGFGDITNVIETYSSGGTVLLRTNQYFYSTNGVDLLLAIGPDGMTNAAYGYNTNHQVTFMTNGVGDVTSYMYDTNTWVLTSMTSPGGLITTYIYNGALRLASTYSYSVIGGVTNYFGTNSYTWANDLVLTHTDERGLTTTNTWDPLERLIKVTYPDGTYVTNTYSRLDIIQTVDRMGFVNSFGFDGLDRLLAQTNADSAVTRYGYCACGALTSLTNAFGTSVQAVTTFAYDNQGNRTVIAYPDLYAVTNHYNSVHQLTNAIDSAGVSVTNWFLNQGLKYAASNYFGQVFNLTFDIRDRVATNTDANGVSTIMTYDNLGRVLTRSYPDGGKEKFGYLTGALSVYTNQLTNVTHYGNDAALRKTIETNANSEVTQFSYNPAGDLLTLTDGKTQVTTWHYDIYGLVSNKVDNDANILLVYHYDPDQRLTNRNSIVKGNTYYHYDNVGNLTNITYPVSPAISLGYDALNRLTSMIDSVGTTHYGYDAVGQLLSEDGPWNDDTVTFTYNNRRRFGLSLLQPTADPWAQTYGYDGARRLTSIASPAGSFGYAYDGTRQLQAKKLTLPNGAYITYAYDNVARLITNELMNSGGTILNAHNYGYNVGNQRTSQTFLNANYENYTYDNIGQLTTALGKESGGANRLQEQLKYGYDAAHNLNTRTNNALVETFSVNNLNEMSNITQAGTLTVAGTTTSPATNVTINGNTNTVLYNDATFALGGFGVTNGNNTFTAIASDSLGRSATNGITVFHPATEAFTYDLNGNLLTDGYRTFTYDDENQLTSAVLSNGVTTSMLTTNIYDGKMRRRIRKDYAWSGGWVQTAEVHYIYDGNLVIQERDANNLPTVSYTRGNDLSGSLQAAGGIGGLLARSDLSTLNPQPSTAYYHSDGNGNVSMLINASQAIVAKYEYDPYGNITSQSGSLADANTYRFSSKEFNKNYGLIYYLYRFYDPNLQRWPNSDPLGERGFELIRHLRNSNQRHGPNFPTFVEFKEGPDLYEFVKNSPVCEYDILGLDHDPCGCDDGLWGCLFDLKNNETTAGTTLGGILLELWKTGKVGISGTLGGLGFGLLFTADDCYSTYFGCLSGCPYPHNPPTPSCPNSSEPPQAPSNGDPYFPTF